MVTLDKIAQACNVSITTVSRVLNDDQTLNVSLETRKKVIETANRLGYKKKKKTNNNSLHIGVVLWYDTKQEIDDPYFMEIRHGIEKLSKEQDVYIMTIYRENNVFNLDQIKNVDGIIAIGKFTEKEINAFERITPAIVFVDSSPSKHKYDSVVIDYQDAVKQVLNYMIDNGYKNIGYLGAYEKINDTILFGERREQYFRQYLEKKDLYNPSHVHIGEFTSLSGYSLMQNAIKDNKLADIYFCANDSIAIGALKAIHEANISIPKKIAIIGFNDIAQSQYVHPSLTTVKVETSTMGEEALLSLIERIKNNNRIAIKKVIPTRFIKRQTT
ncbi:MAG: LacI family DNA-binding transcriptional regulator [Bacillota bacterium]